MMEYLSPFLWTLFQVGCSMGVSYGVFGMMYYSAIHKYKNNPPNTINGREISKQKWEDVCNSCDRYPFYNMPETVIQADFLTSPLKHEDKPVVDHNSLRFSQKVGPSLRKDDESVLWIALITLGRSPLTFALLQLLNALTFAAVGFYAGMTDPVAKYVRLPIKKLD